MEYLDSTALAGNLFFKNYLSVRKQVEQERQELINELSDFKLAFDKSAIVDITNTQGIIT
ncbi:MAG: hypothetical protein HRU34_23655 [Richelia sp.]|nr:hypothetical protein [Richelia sp.]